MQDTLIIVFIGVVAAALLIQSIALIGVYISVRRLSNKVEGIASGVVKNLNFLSSKADEVLATAKSVGEGIISLQQNVNATATVVQNRVRDLDCFLGEATDIARLQLLRVQDAIDTASRRVEETFDTLHNSIVAPANEISAVIRGIRVGLDVLLKRRRVPAGNIHQDEEMFI